MSGGVPAGPIGATSAVALVATVAALAAARDEVEARRTRRRLGMPSRSSGPTSGAPPTPAAGCSASRSDRRLPVPSVVRRAVLDLAIAGAPEAVWAGWLAAIVVAGLGGLLVGGIGLALTGAAVVLAAPAVVVVVGRGRRARLVDHQLPLVLDRLARAVRAGSSLTTAFTEVGAGAPEPLAGELARVELELRAGERLTHALERWAARCPTPGVRLVVAATTLGHEAGGAQARALDGVASTLRERQAVQREARALASQARASAAVIVLAPLAFAAFSAATDPAVLGFLFGTPIGVACLAVAVVLDAAGAVWMARLTRGVG